MQHIYFLYAAHTLDEYVVM